MSLIAGNLGVVQRLLDEHHITWGVCAGAAAHLYGHRRPLQDVDILVTTGQLSNVVRYLQSIQKAVQWDGARIIWRGIKLFDDVSVRERGLRYPFVMDGPMGEHLRRIPLLGAPVMVLAPEDVLIHKLLMNRSAEQGKHDLADAQGVVRRQQLDTAYLAQRMELCGAADLLRPRLAALGVVLDDAKVEG
jgi:hypothetical protein